MQKVYLETSAVNYMASILEDGDAAATKRLQKEKGRLWFISTTVLWELLQTQDTKRLEHLLTVSSELFQPKLVLSPAEIMVEYIRQRMPAYLRLWNPYTRGEVGKIWTKACRTGIPPLRLSDRFTEVTKELKLTSMHVEQLYRIDADKEALPPFLQSLSEVITATYNTIYDDEVTEVYRDLRRLGIVIGILVLCLGIDLSHDVVEAFWKKKGISGSLDRVHFLVKYYPSFFYRGPVLNMANAIRAQSLTNGGTNRGTLHDAMHAVYLPIVDVFLTNDFHFTFLRDHSKQEYRQLYYRKIFAIKEGKVTRVWNKT